MDHFSRWQQFVHISYLGIAFVNEFIIHFMDLGWFMILVASLGLTPPIQIIMDNIWCLYIHSFFQVVHFY
jgi:hypothetical protein